MTALRFQTGGRHQTSPASLRGGTNKPKNTQANKHKKKNCINTNDSPTRSLSYQHFLDPSFVERLISKRRDAVTAELLLVPVKTMAGIQHSNRSYITRIEAALNTPRGRRYKLRLLYGCRASSKGPIKQE